MGSGGPRARSGPPPDPRALRRAEDWGDWIELPASGRTGRVPAWPLVPKATAAERALWGRLWKSPQAMEWERLGDGHHYLVGLYVRRFIEAAIPGSPAQASTVARQLADALGLTLPGMQRNRWRIVDRGPQPRAEVTQISRRRSARPARDRLKVVGDES